MSSSEFVSNSKDSKIKSQLIKSVTKGIESLKSYSVKPEGVFGSKARIICGDTKINSEELDLEFTVDFDDDMEANEAEIIVYNLTDTTINTLKYHNKISIEAGYTGDTGVVFSGYITKKKTKYSGAEKITTIYCVDDIEEHTIEEITYKEGTNASYILKDLLNRTGLPIAVFNMRRDWTYTDEVKVDGDLMSNIKQYSEVCGVSTYISEGKIISRYIKLADDDLIFNLNESTGLIGSPTGFEEKITAEDYEETVSGYECEMILQHRMKAGAKVALKSLNGSGTFRVCSGQHRFNNSEAITKAKMY